MIQNDFRLELYVPKVLDASSTRSIQSECAFCDAPAKEDVQVNQVDLSSDKNDEEEEWPEEEVMCGRVETRSSKRSKDDERDNRKHSRKSDDRKTRGEEKASSKADSRSAGRPSAMREPPSAWPDTKTDKEAVRVLKQEYVPDIKDKVTELLKEALPQSLRASPSQDTTIAHSLHTQRSLRKSSANSPQDSCKILLLRTRLLRAPPTPHSQNSLRKIAANYNAARRDLR
ncbi:hypothetical protein AXG93_3072s1000 [Marchantia polymorpha subsp. ruderalis]|uniref:Uncharacterized protein n=1 Tax=Marchantia polymorpha subsp. ruderalis TaxID=1480154 RepID=A0A176WF80_MARPO|nr:hypothetical protein AXG93_3072s1000 [Marchantia polymorpha subsp. ruderalis]